MMFFLNGALGSGVRVKKFPAPIKALRLFLRIISFKMHHFSTKRSALDF